jgi:ATP-dependent protease ClpP protease subunit
MRCAIVLLVVFFSIGSARAAVIERNSLGPGLPELILVHGELVPSDIDQFRAVAGSVQKAVVALDGPGGNLLAGISIGEMIRLRNFETVVLDQNYCASACALAWLGGTSRYMAPTGRIGFHAAWNSKSGEVSGVANALVGAYLNKIGMGLQAIVYITAAAPNSMMWLTLDDAKNYGIDVSLLSQQVADAPPSAMPPASKQLTPMETDAINFVQRHAAAESAPAESALARVGADYGDTVFYYGKNLARAVVLQEFQTFVGRWPKRSYLVRADSIEVHCFPASQLCNVTAVLDWVAISGRRGKKSEGQSTWSLGLLRQGGAFAITAVNGSVLKRRITDLATDAVATEQ